MSARSSATLLIVGALACTTTALHTPITTATALRTPPPLLSASRARAALPLQRDELDKKILGVTLPSIANLAVIPIVGAVDTFWIGRMGDALALAGQGAANQCFFSTYFLIAFIPTITAPLVAKAAGSGDIESAATRVAEALFLANVLGLIGTLLLCFRPGAFLSVVLPAGAPAAEYAIKYLRLRSISLVPALLSSVGFAAFRGLLDNVTPLKVSLGSNLLNLVLDPILIFTAKMGVAGAALATAISEIAAGGVYVLLLLKRRLLRLGQLIQPPKLGALVPLIAGGAAMLMRQIALNIAFVCSTRRTQAMDVTGVAAASYAITNQVYSLGVVIMLAFQAAGATLVPSALAAGEKEKAGGGEAAARTMADRLIGWATMVAAGLAVAQAASMPFLTPIFTPLVEVRKAIARPALVSALVQLTNGPVFAGEGIMMGLGAFGPLALLTSIGVSVMVAGLTLSAKLGLGVSSVWFSLLGFHIVQGVGAMLWYFFLSPLAQGGGKVNEVDCEIVPGPAPESVGEVCVEVEA